MNLLTPVGFSSYAMEFHSLYPLAFATHVVSLICEGVFDRFPSLRIVLVEAGMNWIVPLMWRLEKHWDVFKMAAKRRPVDYVRDNLAFTTQPLDEPENPKHLQRMMEWTGADKNIMFSSDYPHWDYDDPAPVLRRLAPAIRERIMFRNAIDIYGLPSTRLISDPAPA
jgi:predicted TIM-barrel fold metal-dependent hydrolase